MLVWISNTFFLDLFHCIFQNIHVLELGYYLDNDYINGKIRCVRSCPLNHLPVVEALFSLNYVTHVIKFHIGGGSAAEGGFNKTFLDQNLPTLIHAGLFLTNSFVLSSILISCLLLG